MTVLVPEEKQIIKQSFSLATLVLLFGQYSSESLIIQHSQRGKYTNTYILPLPIITCVALSKLYLPP